MNEIINNSVETHQDHIFIDNICQNCGKKREEIEELKLKCTPLEQEKNENPKESDNSDEKIFATRSAAKENIDYWKSLLGKQIESRYKPSGKTTPKAVGIMAALIIPAGLLGGLAGGLFRLLTILCILLLGIIAKGTKELCGCLPAAMGVGICGGILIYFLVPAALIGRLAGLMISDTGNDHENSNVSLAVFFWYCGYKRKQLRFRASNNLGI